MSGTFLPFERFIQSFESDFVYAFCVNSLVLLYLFEGSKVATACRPTCYCERPVYLDLSSNLFSGQIPGSLSSLNQLGTQHYNFMVRAVTPIAELMF